MMRSYGIYNDKYEELPVILKDVNINGNICGEFVEFTIEQTFENVGEDNIEAIYSFPIPDRAIITGFEANLGGGIFKAVVEEKNKAKDLWEQAVEDGVNTLKIECDEDNIYNVTIGNILPNEVVKVKVSYMDQLPLEEGGYKLIIPAMEGPIGIDGMKDTINHYDLSVNLLIESFSKLKIWSPSHEIEKDYDSSTLLKVTLKNGETLDRDFLLSMKEETAEEFDAIVYTFPKHEKDESLVYLKLFPDLEEEPHKASKNYIVLMDLSKAMEGNNINEIKSSLGLGLRNLNVEDKFNILAFHEQLQPLSEGFLKCTDDNIDKTLNWVKNLSYGSDSDVEGALKWALNQGEDSTIILFTNDMVEDDENILQYVRENIKDNRIFPIGVDEKVNGYFISEVARISGGKADIINRGERLGDLIVRQFNRITGPEIDVTEILWGGEVIRTYPRTIEYIYDLEPFSIFARVKGEAKGEVIIKGYVGEKPFERAIPLEPFELKENAYLIEKVWSRKRIESIEEAIISKKGAEKESMKNKIIELSKDFGIISSETSFMFVEEMEDPLFGMVIQKILPLDVSEETMEHLSYGYFLDAPSFLYKITKEEEILPEEEKLYRYMAENQKADGAICLANSLESERVKYTLKAIIAFATAKENTTVYVKVINRALTYVMDYLNNNKITKEEQLLYFTAFRALVLRDFVVKDKRATFKDSYDKVLNSINEKPEGYNLEDMINFSILRNMM